MMTQEQLQAGWAEFSAKMPMLVAEGSLQSTFAFLRIDTKADGGMVTHMLAYNLNELTHLGMVAYQLHSLHDQIQKGDNPVHKHKVARVLNLFNKLFSAEADIKNKRDIN